MKKSILLLSAFAILLTLSGCFGAKQASVAGRGGEVVGVSGRSFVEPAPYGISPYQVLVSAMFARFACKLCKHQDSRRKIQEQYILEITNKKRNNNEDIL